MSNLENAKFTINYHKTIPLNLKYLEENVTNKQKLTPFDYKANIRKHVIATKDMSNRDKELYLIDKKLGKLENYIATHTPNLCNVDVMAYEKGKADGIRERDAEIVKLIKEKCLHLVYKNDIIDLINSLYNSSNRDNK
jgi:hypothetical protein